MTREVGDRLKTEEAPTNCASGGQVAGLGGSSGEPGVDLKKRRRVVPFSLFLRKNKKKKEV